MTTRSQAALRGTIGGVGLGVCLGAALMYLFDADSGRRRRALARDRAVRALHRGSRSVKATTRAARRVVHRARGAAAGTRWRLRRPAEEVPDEVLQQRVRAALGHLAGYPALVEVRAAEGEVTLSGPVLEREAKRLVRRLRKLPGVRSVTDRLEPVRSLAGRDGGGGGAAGPVGDPA
jgi:hypothetical protein